MEAERTYICGRCGTEFSIDQTHTEVVRRDFVGHPRPSRIERLCEECFRDYVEGFLDRDYEDVITGYKSEA